MKELLKRVQADKDDKLAANTANLLFETATLRSGFMLKDSVDFASRIESMLKSSLSLNADEQVEEEPEIEETPEADEVEADEEAEQEKKHKIEEEHTEL